jgi:tetratricopeptide (TPR) repeat protein
MAAVWLFNWPCLATIPSIFNAALAMMNIPPSDWRSQMPTSKKPREKKAPAKTSGGSANLTLESPDLRAMEDYFRDLAGRSADEALNRAQDLMYQAWEARTTLSAVTLAKRALKTSPLCADAYVLLAERSAASRADAKRLYELAVKAGEMALGPRGFKEYAGHFWGFLETRPYMRARAGLAQLLWDEGQHAETVGHYQDMLKLNPSDNQGLRYLLAACLLRMKDDAGLQQLLKEHSDDASTFMIYTQTLLAFRKEGASKKAEKLAKEAWQSNAHVPAALAGSKEVKFPGYYSMGGEDEAAYYLAEYGSAWRDTPGAIQWLVEATGNLKPKQGRAGKLH